MVFCPLDREMCYDNATNKLTVCTNLKPSLKNCKVSLSKYLLAFREIQNMVEFKFECLNI